MELILASTSPYRKMLLDARGIRYTAVAPLCNEEELKDPSLDAVELTQKLAAAKAESLKGHYPNAFIVGSDQVLHFNHKIFGKPKTKERAISQLLELQGKTHELVTSLHIHSPQRVWKHTERVSLTMHPWTLAELEAYVEADLPLDCAGSYKLEKRGLILFKDIHATDYESIIGLPLIKLFSILKDEGFKLF